MSYELGVNAGVEAINDKQPLNALLNAVVQVGTTPTGAAMLAGLCASMASVFDAFQKLGYRFQMSTPAGQKIADAQPQGRRLHMAVLRQRLVQSAADVLGDLANAIYLVGESIKSSTVNIVPTEPESPTKIEIVAMPKRTTFTDITRDASGSIVESHQVERELEPR